MEHQSKTQIDAYEAHLCDIGQVALDDLHALSISIAWPHRRADWEHLREIGHGFAALDQIGRVIGSAMWFPCGDGFDMVGMVITSPRLQSNGTGLWLMRTVLDHVPSHSLRLNATRAAQKLYGSLAFRPEQIVFHRQGIASMGHPVAGDTHDRVRPLAEADFAGLLDLDTAAFGARREHVLRSLVTRSTGYGLVRGGALAAFALCRSFGRGKVVGPVVAGSDADAIAVVQPHITDHNGHFLRLDSYVREGPFSDFLVAAGLQPYDTVLTMSLGEPAPLGRGRAPVTYALASQTLG